jgi:predicted nucleic acid-binding Zn ribbon protein
MKRKYKPVNYWQPAGKVLHEVMKDLQLDKRLTQEKVWLVWEEAVGKTIAQVAQPEFIKFHTLFVKVSDSIWLHQLSCCHDLLRDKINERVGVDIIKKIHFKLGDFR